MITHKGGAVESWSVDSLPSLSWIDQQNVVDGSRSNRGSSGVRCSSPGSGRAGRWLSHSRRRTWRSHVCVCVCVSVCLSVCLCVVGRTSRSLIHALSFDRSLESLAQRLTIAALRALCCRVPARRRDAVVSGVWPSAWRLGTTEVFFLAFPLTVGVRIHQHDRQ